jgi:hypothetical protein
METIPTLYYCTLDSLPGLCYLAAGAVVFAPAEMDILYPVGLDTTTLLVTAQVPDLLTRHLYTTHIAPRRATHQQEVRA